MFVNKVHGLKMYYDELDKMRRVFFATISAFYDGLWISGAKEPSVG
jgi:hypothetical protein